MNLPYISVVVPCYNCENTIHHLLTSLETQDYSGDYEVICVDDGSTDETPRKIKGFESVIYIYQKNNGPAYARNTGAAKARGDVLAFTDSDCIPESNWLTLLVKGFEVEGVVAVAGSYGIANSQYRLARGVHLEILFRHYHIMNRYVRAFGSYNVAIVKRVFDDMGGFNVSYRRASGEDNDLSYKIIHAGFKIYFQREAKVKHFHPQKVMRYLQEQYRHGFWRVMLYRHHPEMKKGDDYTFWKDIIEPPIVLGLLLIFFMFLFQVSTGNFFLSCLMLFIIFEVFFGLIYCRHFFDGVYFGVVMALRSVARTAGFLVGVLSFLISKT